MLKRLWLLLVLASLATGWPVSVSAQERVEYEPGLTSPDPLAGTWRMDSFDRFGAKRELITFEPRASLGFYDYLRRDLVRVRGQRHTRERGRAELVGEWFTTQQTPRDPTGLVSAFSDPEVLTTQGLRQGNYKLHANGYEARGFSHVLSRLRIAKERLVRLDAAAPRAEGGRDNNHVELLVDGREFFPRLREALEGAERSICLQTFIYTEDTTGRWVARLLMDKAREGVQVRVLCDNINTKISRGLRNELKEAGVELIVQHTWAAGIGNSVKNFGLRLWDNVGRIFGRPKPHREERGVFNHDHRKITVVDGRVGFIGGMNIAHEYEHVWHDVQARIEGDAVQDMETLFYDRWKTAGGQVIEMPAPDPRVGAIDFWPGDMSVDIAETLPNVKTDIRRRYHEEIAAARDRVWIECAYFLDEHIIRQLRERAHEGLDVAVIVPNDDDHDVKIVRDAFNWVQNDVVRSGIRLYKYPGRMVHSKVAAFDGRVATVGSSNLDNMALEHLAEANAFVNDPRFAREMEVRIFQTDFPNANLVEVEKMSWWKKLKAGVLHFFRTLL